jgi:hypothetical protein
MMQTLHFRTLVVLSSAIASAFGQDATPPPPKPTGSAAEAAAALEAGSMPAAATVEKIMQEAVRNISRRYNLNEAQIAETDKLMKREVHKFLKEHEAVVWPAIRDLLAVQLGGSNPGAEEAARIGKAAQPLVGKAKEAIFRANEEWRTYLTAEQKTTHDYDLAEMEKSFQQIEKNFSDWAAGKPTDAGLFPPPAIDDRSPRRAPKPKGGLPEPEVETFRVSIFDTFVEEFIRENQLDQGQIDTARSILKEFKVKANDFKETKKEELTKIAAEQKAALDARDRERMKAADTALKKALEPVQALFGEMEERLKALLTSTQLERYVARRPTGTTVDVAPKTPIPKGEPAPLPPAPAPAPAKAEKPEKTGGN